LLLLLRLCSAGCECESQCRQCRRAWHMKNFSRLGSYFFHRPRGQCGHFSK
jgi:hypothetical protein